MAINYRRRKPPQNSETPPICANGPSCFFQHPHRVWTYSMAQTEVILCFPAVPRRMHIWHPWFPCPPGTRTSVHVGGNPTACTEFVNKTCPVPTWDGSTPFYLHKHYGVCSSWRLCEQCWPRWPPGKCIGGTKISAYQMCISQPSWSSWLCHWIPFFSGIILHVGLWFHEPSWEWVCMVPPKITVGTYTAWRAIWLLGNKVPSSHFKYNPNHLSSLVSWIFPMFHKLVFINLSLWATKPCRMSE